MIRMDTVYMRVNTLGNTPPWQCDPACQVCVSLSNLYKISVWQRGRLDRDDRKNYWDEHRVISDLVISDCIPIRNPCLTYTKLALGREVGLIATIEKKSARICRIYYRGVG